MEKGELNNIKQLNKSHVISLGMTVGKHKGSAEVVFCVGGKKQI